MTTLRFKNVMIWLTICIISLILVSDFLFHSGQSVAFDAPTHISNIAQVYGALADGEWPARWGNGFARYGMPIPIIAQQVTSYLGAVLTIATHNVLISYYVVMWLGALLSAAAMYTLLRKHTDELPALAGTILFHFAPYRIMNVYIRGALPEFFSTFFIILIMLSLHKVFVEKDMKGYFFLICSLTMLLLTHPFMVIVGAFVIVPYGVYLWLKSNMSLWRMVVALAFGMLMSLALSAYYLVPLFVEIKYFYYGLAKSHFVEGHFLSLNQFLVEKWYYFYKGDIFPRAHLHTGGFIEGIIFVASIGYLIVMYRKKQSVSMLIFSLIISGLVIILFTQPVTRAIYANTPFGNIQHPWRMLSAYILIPPFLLALLLQRLSVQKQNIIILIVVIFIALMRFPQLYGKNYTQHPLRSYFVTDYNLHGQVMNTVWMGNELDYPHRQKQYGVVEGKAHVSSARVQNARREYQVDVQNRARFVDYTFYYPGWKLYVDGIPTEIQFQDPNYRGVITYYVPEGKHEVRLVFEETLVRKFANAITLLSVIGFGFVWMLRKKKYIRNVLCV